MTKDELYNKAIEIIQDTDFPCFLSAYGGGACGDGWTDGSTLSLSRAQLLYLIFNKDVVNGEKTEEVDPVSILNDMAYEGSWPDGEPEDEDISCWRVSGESIELDNYIESWDIILEKIKNGDINENNFAKWFNYFDDTDNWSEGIEEWKEFNDKYDED